MFCKECGYSSETSCGGSQKKCDHVGVHTILDSSKNEFEYGQKFVSCVQLDFKKDGITSYVLIQLSAFILSNHLIPLEYQHRYSGTIHKSMYEQTKDASQNSTIERTYRGWTCDSTAGPFTSGRIRR